MADKFNHMVKHSNGASLNSVFHALADPTRRAMLQALASNPLPVGELAAPFHMSLAAVSKHIKVLEQAGLISRSRNGQQRPCRLKPERLAAVQAWLGNTRGAWETRLDRLEHFIATRKET